jgi:hypothetical protein
MVTEVQKSPHNNITDVIFLNLYYPCFLLSQGFVLDHGFENLALAAQHNFVAFKLFAIAKNFQINKLFFSVKLFSE